MTLVTGEPHRWFMRWTLAQRNFVNRFVTVCCEITLEWTSPLTLEWNPLEWNFPLTYQLVCYGAFPRENSYFQNVRISELYVSKIKYEVTKFLTTIFKLDNLIAYTLCFYMIVRISHVSKFSSKETAYFRVLFSIIRISTRTMAKSCPLTRPLKCHKINCIHIAKVKLWVKSSPHCYYNFVSYKIILALCWPTTLSLLSSAGSK